MTYSGHLKWFLFKIRSPKNTKTRQGIKIHLMKLPTNEAEGHKAFQQGL